MWSRRVRSDAAGPPTPTPTPKGGDGMLVNSCTTARKLEVSVVSTVVGARRDARVRFRDPLGGCASAPCPGAAAATIASPACWRPPEPESGCATSGNEEEDSPEVPANDPETGYPRRALVLYRKGDDF
jgi:hypothetical protein